MGYKLEGKSSIIITIITIIPSQKSMAFFMPEGLPASGHPVWCDEFT